MGSPITLLAARPVAGAVDDAEHASSASAQKLPVGGGAHRHARHRRSSSAREAVGVVARHRAVERAAVRHDVEAGARAARPAARSSSSRRPRRRSTPMLMAELLEEAGIPKGVVSVIPAGREVGEHLVRHPGVDKIAFTGSTAAGRTHRVDLRRAAQAGEPRARRQVGGHHPRRRRPRGHDGGPEVRVADEQRPGVRGPDPHPRRRGATTTPSSTLSARRSAA